MTWHFHNAILSPQTCNITLIMRKMTDSHKDSLQNKKKVVVLKSPRSSESMQTWEATIFPQNEPKEKLTENYVF